MRLARRRPEASRPSCATADFSRAHAPGDLLFGWENADKYEADLILHDGRAHAPSPDDLTKIPVWSRFPAVAAGQLAPWHREEAVSYRLFGSHVEELTAAIERAEVIT